jgi:hypothetical protein
MKSQKSNVSLAAWRSKKTGRLLTASPSISATRAQWDDIRISFDVSSIQISMFNEELLPAAYDVHEPFMSHSCSIHFASNSGKI